LELTQEPRSFLQFVIPTLVQRLAQPEITEPSEELRLQLIELTRSTIDRCNVHVAPYLNDLVLSRFFTRILKCFVGNPAEGALFTTVLI